MEAVIDTIFNSGEVDTRFGLSSPTFVISVILSYLLFVYKIGPRLMQNRPPLNLKQFMSIYNIVQVSSCLYLVNGIWSLLSWDLFNFNKCIYYSANTPGSELFDKLTYFTFWLKIVELLDTIIFVLRKKENQITYLHVFHHSSTITLVYLLLKYYRGNGPLFPIYLNSWVHVIMYTYYFFANICSADVMKKFILIKKSITIIQMIQFCFILAQAAIMWTNCQIPFILRVYHCVVVGIIFYGFYDFYKKAYTNPSVNKLKNKIK
ncbi:elongation of very long chain fatty acids protein 1 [Lucilia sericata]|uniref:elongation of very long chain fatty acids protein 1 n=1 Tax=Lucilia sericata TaxID=13632 RepID=UPI0018A851A0|nr:elongation of very long chain fatty acids protein 1 [Lucilia sericata]